MPKNSTMSFEWLIKSSLIQLRILVITHVAALMAVLISAVSLVYKGTLVLTIAVSAWVYWQNYFRKNSTTTIRYTDALGWELFEGHEYRPIKILGSTVVTPMVIVLHFSLDNHTRHWAIFNDALGQKEFIQLIVQLKIAGVTE
ncbi:MAG: protein YgfX [Gammaproteobacteria bacterium]